MDFIPWPEQRQFSSSDLIENSSKTNINKVFIPPDVVNQAANAYAYRVIGPSMLPKKAYSSGNYNTIDGNFNAVFYKGSVSSAGVLVGGSSNFTIAHPATGQFDITISTLLTGYKIAGILPVVVVSAQCALRRVVVNTMTTFSVFLRNSALTSVDVAFQFLAILPELNT